MARKPPARKAARKAAPRKKASSRPQAPRRAARAARPARRAKAGKAAKGAKKAKAAASAMSGPPGSIVHTELGCHDPAAARTFLGDIFGWQFEDMPGPQPYAMVQANGAPIGGLRGLFPQESASSITPYVTVKNLNATLGAIEVKGGKVVVPPMPVPKMGWFFWFQVPGGPILGCWQDDPKAPMPKM